MRLLTKAAAAVRHMATQATQANQTHPFNLTFLGTASAVPSSTRGHSSLTLRIGADVWMFDCGEGTQRQFPKSDVKLSRITKIFLTHLHGDHVFGVVPLMAGLLNGTGGMEGDGDPREAKVDVDNPSLEIYGPLGTRAYIRSNLTLTHTCLGSSYVVHELRFPRDPKTGDFTALSRNHAESPAGRNIQQTDGVWKDFVIDGNLSVSAGPIKHSVPCVGYVVAENSLPGKVDPSKYIPELKRTGTPLSAMRELQDGKSVTLKDGTILHGPARRRGRKVVILGDTSNPSGIEPLAQDCDLLIHEATNAHLPGVDSRTKDDETYASVEQRTRSRGHSTPQMAGIFAKRIRAKALILNHFSTKYADGSLNDGSQQIMNAIQGLAADAYGGPVLCASDFMTYTLDPPPY
ncbi:hypothetical protein MKEN_00081800 [Mycena kentingensis (nom. inval.)]|nr:hypothetical protein MKEN_00081800 [Mycena kentingensis (nom. inval.)]